jgi:hypothetical protein
MHAISVGIFAPALGDLVHVLNRGAEFAKAKSIDTDTLTEARLAPDMLPLSAQVGIACHHALDAAARLSGETPPVRTPGKWTYAELLSHAEATAAKLMAFPAAAFEGSDERTFEVPLQAGRVLAVDGLQLLRDWSMPNFYFHVVTAYDILRHQGVEIGKRDFMNHSAPLIRSAD